MQPDLRNCGNGTDMIGVFLQLRVNSTRLPRKALLDLAGRTVAEHAMAALDTVDADLHCVLIPENSVHELEPLIRKAGWELFVGPEEDVLARFVLAARTYGVKRIVRATGDNPLVSADMASVAMGVAARTGAHYTAFSGLPTGSGVEILDAAALEEAFDMAEDPYEREHVAPYLYRHPRRFHIETPDAPPEVHAPDIRITLDTKADYRYLKRLFANLYNASPIPLQTVVAWARKNPFHAG